eukprot:TRINITY_DN948_c0_g1_i2.p1 TRINITY_DN948_c0_g1~~TRINITY_DN948_c0_g1_i2.p1  ORF type:complete len:288 (+),score=47.24 TRINITY_DN948_c0_g1_i2:23-865(+)
MFSLIVDTCVRLFPWDSVTVLSKLPAGHATFDAASLPPPATGSRRLNYCVVEQPSVASEAAHFQALRVPSASPRSLVRLIAANSLGSLPPLQAPTLTVSFDAVLLQVFAPPSIFTLSHTTVTFSREAFATLCLQGGCPLALRHFEYVLRTRFTSPTCPLAPSPPPTATIRRPIATRPRVKRGPSSSSSTSSSRLQQHHPQLRLPFQILAPRLSVSSQPPPPHRQVTVCRSPSPSPPRTGSPLTSFTESECCERKGDSFLEPYTSPTPSSPHATPCSNCLQ